MNARELPASPEQRAATALVADVGGSNARFGWLDGQTHRIQHVACLSVADHPGLVEAARHYLEQIRRQLGTAFRAPQAAAIAVATPVSGDHVEMTNSDWSFSRQAACSSLGLAALHVLNDFEALALALPHLTPHQVRQIGPVPAAGERAAPATLAVVGPGTGLGVAGVIPTASGWIALPGEGGHATRAPGNDFEAALLGWVRKRHSHVSAERFLSGIGLPVLHGAVADVLGIAAAGRDLDAPAIVDAGLAGDDVARRTLDVFCALLGSFAGNVALTLGARGGLFVGGGIVPRLGSFFDASQFRRRFEDKGRLSSYLASIPTAVITDTLAALTGAAASLDQHLEPAMSSPLFTAK
jgi:glucokinase